MLLRHVRAAISLVAVTSPLFVGAHAADAQSIPTITTVAEIPSYPQGWLRTDAAGYVYFNDDQGIHKLDPSSGVIVLVAGTEGAGAFDVDGLGNVYFAAGNVVERVDVTSGEVTLYAGGAASTLFLDLPTPINGGQTKLGLPSGDGGPAVDAFIANVFDLVLDASGNLFVCDLARVRKVDATTGGITTVAGNGAVTIEYLDASQNPADGYIVVGVASGDGSAATLAGIEFPAAITVDAAGNLYVFDWDVGNDGEPPTHSTIRRIDANSGTITHYAGIGVPGTSGDGGPAALAAVDPIFLEADSSGDLYLSEWSSVVRRIDASSTNISTIAGSPFQYGFAGDDGPAVDAILNTPGGLAFGPGGELYVIDDDNFRIRVIASPPNTPAGNNVAVDETASDGTAVMFQFDTVSTSGETSVTATAPGQTQAPPQGFRFGTPPVVYQLETTATFTGDVHVCFSWEQGRFNNEAGLRLFHSSGGSGWTDITDVGSPDTVGNTICGTTTSFSYFAFLEPAPDADGDGLSDDEESAYNTNPLDPDSDHDGLWDGTEIERGTNPLNPDSDGDGLVDGAEVDGGTNPLNADSDGDGWGDMIDPEPMTPNDTQWWLECNVRQLAGAIGELELALFDGPNLNANKGRRNSLATRVANAANAIAAGNDAAAIDLLTSVASRMDGLPCPSDWVLSGPARDCLQDELALYLLLLGL